MIGDIDALDNDFSELENKASDARIESSLDKGSEIIKNRGVGIAKAKQLYKTGKGVAGIGYQKTGPFARGIGWGPRPNLHLYFHEIGTYKDPPRPHLRPAADESSREVTQLLQNDIVEK